MLSCGLIEKIGVQYGGVSIEREISRCLKFWRWLSFCRYQPSFNVAPGAYMPVVRHDSASDASEPIVHCMRWGLVPSFTKKSERPDFYRMVRMPSVFLCVKRSGVNCIGAFD